MKDSNARYMAIADLYLEEFPIDDTYPAVDFDRWAYSIDSEYKIPVIAKKLGDKGWGTHLQNRHSLKTRINKGGRCLQRASDEMFQIEVINTNEWQTQRLVKHTSMRTNELAYAIDKLVDTKCSHLEELLTIVHEHSSLLSEDLRFSIRNMHTNIVSQARRQMWFQATMLAEGVDNTFAQVRAELLIKQENGVDISALKHLFNQPKAKLPKLLSR